MMASWLFPASGLSIAASGMRGIVSASPPPSSVPRWSSVLVLNLQWFCLPGDIPKCLQTFLMITDEAGELLAGSG